MLTFGLSDLYQFDLQGYLHFPSVISPDRLFQLNQMVDRRLAKNQANAPAIRINQLLDKEPVTRDLLNAIDLSPLFGECAYRLDHDYLQVLRSGTISKGLHGGATPHDPAQGYTVKDGKIYCGLVAVSIALTDAPIECGGFGAIVGSHQSNFHPPANDDTFVQPIGVCAGDAIVFTEALRHRTIPWNGHTERRSMFLKFSPVHSAYASDRYSFSHPLVREPSV